MSRAIDWYQRSSKFTKIWSSFKLFSAVDVASYFDERQKPSHFPLNWRSSFPSDHLGLKSRVVELFKGYRFMSVFVWTDTKLWDFFVYLEASPPPKKRVSLTVRVTFFPPVFAGSSRGHDVHSRDPRRHRTLKIRYRWVRRLDLPFFWRMKRDKICIFWP